MKAASLASSVCVLFASCMVTTAQTPMSTPTCSGPQETYPGEERIVGRDLNTGDGSAIIAWKLLKKYSTTKLSR